MAGYENCEYADEWRKMRDYYLGQTAPQTEMTDDEEAGAKNQVLGEHLPTAG